MKYMGSKNRHAKHIVPFLTQHKDKPFVDPFVGGGNILDKIKTEGVGSDINPYVIQALKTIRDDLNRLPKNNTEFTEADYKAMRGSGDALEGYAAFALSYGGKEWGGWRRDRTGTRDYVAEAYRNAVKQSKGLQNKTLHCCAFSEIYIPSNAVVYCDPPYKGTTGYKHNFNHKLFWQWCERIANRGVPIYVSEYNAPEGWQCVWQKEVNNTLVKDTGAKKGIEKLFTKEKV